MYVDWCIGILYKYIGVGFALLVQLYRAMRRPLSVERATGTISTLFYVSSIAFFYYLLPTLGGR